MSLSPWHNYSSKKIIHSAIQPPSMTSDTPVISAAASLASKTMAPVSP